MPFFPTAYETTVGRIFVVKNIANPLIQAIASSDLKYAKMGLEDVDGLPAVFVTGMYAEEQSVPAFAHPLLVTDFRKNKYLAVDVRPFKGKEVSGDNWLEAKKFEDSVRNRPDYVLAKTRARLNQLWLAEENVRSIRTNYAFAGNVMAAWFSSAIQRAYALDYADQATISAMTVYYYRLLFTQEKKLQGEALDTAVVHTIKLTKMPSASVYELFDKIGEINGISDFCSEIAKHTGNIRLEKFNWGVLWNLIQNSWFGVNNKDILAVAVEHPPTFIPLVFAIMKEQAFKSSPLYKVIDSVAKRGAADEFLLNMQDLIRDQVLVAEGAENTPTIPEFED